MIRRTKRPGMQGVRRIARILSLLAFALLPSAANAQSNESGTRDRQNIVGVVTDSLTGSPLAGVLVEIEALDRGAFTDSDGSFRLRGVPHGTWNLRARQLGYEETVVGHNVADQTDRVDLALRPDPVLLDEIRVVTDRIERRRLATPFSVRAYEADELNGSGAFDAMQFLSARLPILNCPTVRAAGDCVLRRGRLIVPRVYIDEVRVLGGLEFLRTYNPNELYLLEIYDSGSQIRLYTKTFAERLALGQERVFPVLVY